MTVIATSHIIFSVFYFVTNKAVSRRSFIMLKVFRFLTFAVYLKIFILVYMYTMIMIVSEIKYYIINDDEDGKARGNITSLSISCVILVSFMVLSSVVFISWMKVKGKIKIDGSCKTKELY